MQPLDVLIRRAQIGGQPASDCRFVVSADGRAAVIGSDGQGGFHALASAFGAEWRTEKDGRVVVDVAGAQWAGQRDTRCGSCGGRYALRTLDPEQFLPQLEQRPDDAEQGEALPAPAYGDSY